MKVKWTSNVPQAARLLKEHDAILISRGLREPVLVLFSNEDKREKAQRVIAGKIAGEHEGYPALFSSAPNLQKRLQRLQT
jgi:hypothetical protein